MRFSHLPNRTRWRRLPFALPFSLLSLILFLSSGSARAQQISAESKERVIRAIEQVVTHSAFVAGADFSKWPDFLEKHRKDVDAATDVAAFTREMNRAFHEFGFSHIGMRSPRQFESSRSASAVGIGVYVRKVEEGLRISSLAVMGPAAASGVEVGDIITEVDGKAPRSPEDLDGEEGSRLALKLKKSTGEVREVALERRRYSTVRPETLQWIGDDVAVLRIPTFNVGYEREAVEKLVGQAARARYLILDLRSNGGGLVSNMKHLLNQLLPDGSPIGTSVTKSMAERYAIATAGDPKDPIAVAKWVDSPIRTKHDSLEPFSGQIAVLLNHGSGSASEIAAAALKDDVGAILVGTKSAGAVLTSLLATLPDGFGLQYPVTDFITSKGVRLEGNPLVPDIEVSSQPGFQSSSTATGASSEPDPVVAKAIEKLRQMGSPHASAADAAGPVIPRLLTVRVCKRAPAPAYG